MAGQITYSVKDSKGVISHFFINLPTSFSLAQALEAAQDFGVLVDNLMGGYISGIGLCYNVTLPGGIKTTADANTDVEEGARFSFNTSGGFFSKFRIPTFLESLLLSGTKQVDLADEDVDAVVSGILDGVAVAAGGGATVTFVDTRDEDLVSLNFARESFGKDRG